MSYAQYLSVDCPGNLSVLIVFNVCTAAIYTDKPKAGHRRAGTAYISYSSHKLSKTMFL